MKAVTYVVLSWAFIFFGSLFLFVYMHEAAHVQINKYYGVDSKIEFFSHFPDIATVQTNSSQVCNEECIFLHSLNEIAGYNVQAMLVLIGFAVVFIWLERYTK